MISWIQRTFQQHFTAVFVVLLAVTIVSFIIEIGATPGVGRADRQVIDSNFFGHNLSSQADLEGLLNDARLSAELQLGYGGLDDDQLKNYALERVAALHTAEALHLPAASSADLANYIQGLRAFAGPDGKFDPSRYDAFRASVRAGGASSEGDITRVMLDDMRIDQVERLLDGPGYVLPVEVRDQLVRSDSRWTIEVATVDYASYHPPIRPTEAEIEQYYRTNAFRYRIPPRMVATYVDFPAARYLPSIDVTEAEIRAAYDADPAKYAPPAGSKPASPKILPATQDANYDAAHARVEADVRLARARNQAAQVASDLTVELYEDKVAEGPALAAVLAAHHLEARPLAPFTHEAGPAEFGGSKVIADAAFQLDSERYYSDALPTPNGAVVLFRQRLLPSRQPQLAEVRSKVVADYIVAQRRDDFIGLGRILRAGFASKLRAGETMAKAASELAADDGVKIETKAYAPFTLLSPPDNLGEPVAGALAHLRQGEVSPMIATADDGILVFARARQLPDLDPAKNPLVDQTREELAGASARLAAAAYLSQEVADELKRSKVPNP
jgi:peptidyl-prolyl cis-trans isomerase D